MRIYIKIQIIIKNGNIYIILKYGMKIVCQKHVNQKAYKVITIQCIQL